jgi:hypothetical protein
MPRLSKIGAACLAAFGWTGISSVNVSYLVIAGGGGGGSVSAGGGGGAGGVQTASVDLNPSLSYTVIVGSGGTGASSAASASGANGSVSSITFSGGTINSADGGGGGAGGGNAGSSGGSGGGGQGEAGTAAGAATSGGNSGGAGSVSPRRGGGGGGRGSDGASGSSSGNGGSGTAYSISGSSVTYAGGGGGGAESSTGGSGGTGGGGSTGGTTAGNGGAGTANLGGGGAGANRGSGNTGSYAGGNGGSGIVIISYLAPQKFSGGVVTTSGGNIIHTFTTSGTLGPITGLSASYLIVAGGGGGGGANGGGGAGGLLTGSSVTIDPNSTYLVTVGAGGSAATASNGGNGGSSSFSMVSTTAVGGGGGGYQGGTTTGANGGSGGGGSYPSSAAGGTGTSGQGTNGGSGAFAASQYGGGGGGGATSAGSNGTSSGGGNGGAGTASSISGSSVTYAGGGGGGSDSSSAGTGGAGGGGAGGISSGVGTAGIANTGGGGGGGSNSGAATASGGRGGSGIVIISYPGSTQLMAGGTVTITGGNVIHTFTSTGYLAPLDFIGNSLRFRSSASAYLNRTFTTPTSSQKFTWGGWIKRGKLDSSGLQGIFAPYSSGTVYGYIAWYQDGIRVYDRLSGGTNYLLQTTAVYRDPAAWYHIVVAVDTTQATASNRVRLYVNGVEVTSFSTSTYPTQNNSTTTNSAIAHNIGYDPSNTGYLDGYQTEINFIDGQALTPNSFGTFNSFGVWQPITYGGSYGTNGFYLPFTNKTSTATIGNDFSPNGNNWTANNFDLTLYPAVFFNTSTTWVAPAGVTSVTYAVVGGGGGGGGAVRSNFSAGGGGGGGRLLTGTLSVTPGTSYTVTVGGGGSAGSGGGGGGGTGSSSVFSSITSAGGNGGSGGSGTGGAGGNSGGGAGGGSGAGSTGGGGGGAGGAGGNGTGAGGISGAGGIGSFTSISGSSIGYGGGGSGAVFAGTASTGAATSGGGQGSYPGQSGTANTGGGAGGGGDNTVIGYAGGTGGSGVVWLSWAGATQVNTTYDSMTDVPTLTSATAANYAVLNPISGSVGAATISNCNLSSSVSATSAYGGGKSTIGIATSSGKWYFEVTATSFVNSGSVWMILGLTKDANLLTAFQGQTAGSLAYGMKYNTTGAQICNETTAIRTDSGIQFAQGDVLQCAFDSGTGKLWFGKNNAWFDASSGTTGNPSAGTNQTMTTTITDYLFPFVQGFSTSGATATSVNFGQQPFVYTPPSGFVALNTFNL